jgi:nucleotide-binding universal stress UspA family protein
MRTIVVGVDGSAASDEALRWAIAEAQQWDGRVVAIHAWDVPYSAYSVPGVVIDDDAVEVAAKQLLTDALARAVDGPAFALEEHVVRGRAAEVLLRAAEDADLVVVGSRHLGAVGRLFLGSVSTAVTHHAPCAVVVVREPSLR